MADAKTPSLRDLVPLPVRRPVGDIVLEIRPMGWDRGCVAMEYLGPAIGAMPLLGDAGGDIGKQSADWMALAITFREEIAHFISVAAEQPIEDVRAIPPAVMAELLMVLVEVNVDFFAQSLSGVLTRMAGRLEELKARLAPQLETAQAVAASITPSSA